MSNLRYDESSMESIENDIDRLRRMSTMYIGYTDVKAVIHLIKEILQNSIDEATSQGSLCESIRVFIDYSNKDNKIVRISDTGRGIPNKVKDLFIKTFTVMHTSGKYNKNDSGAYKFASGEHGVGMKAVNALSKHFLCTSKSNGNSVTVYFEDGHLVDYTENGSTTEQGTAIEFNLDKSVIGADEAPFEDIDTLLSMMSYLVPGIKFDLTYISNTGKAISQVYLSNNGLEDLIKSIVGKRSMLIAPTSFMFALDKVDVDPSSNDVNKELCDIECEIKFTYSPEIDDECILSFVNFCNTTSHGSHVDGFLNGLTSTLLKYTKENVFNKKDKDLAITGNDIKVGLIAVINFNITKAKYHGQIKEKFVVNGIDKIVRANFVSLLNDWIERNKDTVNNLGKYFKTVARARINSNKEKVNFTTDMSIWSNKPKKYHEASGKTNVELFVVEGNSAAGSAKAGRDPKHQAVYELRGNVTNTYNMDINKVFATEELKDLISILGCGVGKTFDMNKLRFEKIIIMTDADIDGFKIRSSMSVFFLKHLPELVLAGKVFVLSPPLFELRLSKNKRIHLINNSDYAHYMKDYLWGKLHINHSDGSKVTKDEFDRFFILTNRYLTNISNLSRSLSIDPIIMEYLAYYQDVKELNKALKKRKDTKFIKVYQMDNHNVLEGPFQDNFQIVDIDDNLYERISLIRNYIRENNDILFYEIDGEICTISEVLTKLKKHEPGDKDKTRFKGLGEMDPEPLWDILMNPETRKLVKLTTDNVSRDLNKFNIIHGDEKKKLLHKFKLDIEDLDA